MPRRKTPLVEFLVLGWLALALVVVLYFLGLFEAGSNLGVYGPVSLNLETILLAYFLLAFLFLGLRRMADRGELTRNPAPGAEEKLFTFVVQNAPGTVPEGEPLAAHFSTLAGLVLASTAADGAVIEILDGDRVAQAYPAGSFAPYSGINQPARGGLAGPVIQTGQPASSADTGRDPRAQGGPPMPRGTRSAAVAAVRHGNQLMGLVRVAAARSHAFDARALRTLDLAGAYAGASLWRGRVSTRTSTAAVDQAATLAASQEARARFEQLADNLPEVYRVTDPKGESLLYVNDAYERIWGRSTQSLSNQPRSWLDAVVPTDRSRVEAALAQASKTGYEVEYRIQRPDRTERSIRERAFLVRDAGTKVVAVAALAEDITEERAAKESLATLERRYRHAFTTGPAVVYAARPTGNYGLTFVSDNVQAILGRSPRAAVDDPNFWTANLHPEDQTRVLAAMPQLFREGRLGHEYRFRHGDGTYRIIRDEMRLVRDPEGEPVEIVGQWVDVTDRKRTEEGLAYSLSRINELQENRTRLLNTIAHDLASPLTPINLQLQLFSMTAESLNKRQRKNFEIIKRNVAQLQRLIEDLKDLARLEAGQLKVDPKPGDLAVLVAKAVDSFQEAAKDQGRKLEARIPKAKIPVQVDEQRITQVVFNFVTNAIKFSPEKGTILVEVVGGKEPTVKVKDSGRGLTAEEIARLFKPFSQVHDRSQMKEKGTGLGLYICKGLIESHRGKIWAESEGLGKGSTFAFTLPADGAQPSSGKG